ncbi:phosphoribosylformylglycinamidine synthase subunit PurL [Lacticaseibacillus mingshuiensis]|uniref:Phosphoribosylformylglycinamidine synthase subunit PurL n=1 Tax=Lacticaseibacillus mingshuiensis TaxID=2799574 RepID=A0ABW4CHN9_9LACO|nr:phosphoribosylformylglycinamidine synthase subunit PurL [Lacticaseibacillus mingshuiensis]
MLQRELSPDQIATEKPYLGLGLNEDEYDCLTTLLGRRPNFTEVGLASGMWSEHCAYKYSKPVLKTFWTKNDRVLMGPGEGAGVIDIGEGKAVVFKAESHNHPSAVEPYQGAATGVGGIIRDIFSIGAKPIALLDSLAFGDPKDPHVRQLIDQIVAGIGDYGNAIGIPTVGGETRFADSYARNPLVNAMCVGVMDTDAIQRGKAAGVGNALIYVGAKTGRDGINGASFASAEFSDDEAADRSAVQVGDPFMEKLLMDACLEVTREHQDALVGMQDMGAAGLVSSSVEMAGKANSGMTLDLDLIPQREPEMTPFEIMLSESQERMMLCVKAGHEDEIVALFKRYDLDTVVCGRVDEGHQYRLLHRGEVVCDVPVAVLTDEAPVYHQKGVQPSRLQQPAPDFEPGVLSLLATLRQLLADPNVADKKAIYRSYDAQVQTNTVLGPGADAAVVRVRGTHRALAMTTDSNGRYLYLDPEIGGAITVAESARNLVATGAEPLGITDCLNYGDPTKPESFYSLAESAKGITAACKAMNTPVISGNVSLYNETNGEAIYPTPMIGMVGLIEDLSTITTPAFKQVRELIYVIGETGPDFNGSLLQQVTTGAVAGALAPFDLTQDAATQRRLLAAIRQHLVTAAHDVSDGGLLVALSDMAIAGGLGAKVDLPLPAGWLFSETQGRFIVTVAPENQAAFESAMGDDAHLTGVVQPAVLTVATNDQTLTVPVHELATINEEALPCLLK